MRNKGAEGRGKWVGGAVCQPLSAAACFSSFSFSLSRRLLPTSTHGGWQSFPGRPAGTGGSPPHHPSTGLHWRERRRAVRRWDNGGRVSKKGRACRLRAGGGSTRARGNGGGERAWRAFSACRIGGLASPHGFPHPQAPRPGVIVSESGYRWAAVAGPGPSAVRAASSPPSQPQSALSPPAPASHLGRPLAGEFLGQARHCVGYDAKIRQASRQVGVCEGVGRGEGTWGGGGGEGGRVVREGAPARPALAPFSILDTRPAAGELSGALPSPAKR